MIIFKQAVALGIFLDRQAANGLSTGFVPTMGALHEGHIALIIRAKQKNDLVIASIFVNPTQFNDPKDFEKYPVTIENDIFKLETAGCDVLFLPSVEEMYPNGLTNNHIYPLGNLESLLEGKYRPGHFQGVCQVVHRLLEITKPTTLFLGLKDYQQCMVIGLLLKITHSNTQLITCPTFREKSGLAMSSRNMRLDENARAKAVSIYETLLFIKKSFHKGHLEDTQQRAIDYLSAEGFKVDYVEICDANTLQPLQNWDGQTPLIALIAAFLEGVRLIDNMILTN